MKLERSISQSHLVRVLIVGGLVLALQVPILMISGLLRERQGTRDRAAADIANGWGGAQAVAGPLIRVPYRARWVEKDDQGRTHTREGIRNAVFLPEELAVAGNVETEVRYRGIYEVPVFRADLTLSGHFARPEPEALGVPAADILWERAELVLALGDPRGVKNRAELGWNGETLAFRPGASCGMPGFGAIRVPLHGHLGAAGSDGPDGFAFSIPLVLNGTERLSFAPVGDTSTVALSGDWPHPSFQGEWLPGRREVGPQGFDADWAVSSLGRGYPQRWLDGVSDATGRLASTSVGLAFVVPVDPYSMARRSVKYAALFLVLTFATIWLFEVVSGLRVHPLQYLLVGAALCLFYLLQLSLAEHLGFAAAYALASVAIAGMVSLYSRVFLGSTRRMGIVAGVVAALYGTLFVVLRLEDYAMLVGTLLLVVALGAVMWATRRVDWYRLETLPDATPEPSLSEQP